MDSQRWYRVDTRKVAHETIDGEVIMIHLELGNYFSLDGVGADIWERLVLGQSREQIVTGLEHRYDAEPGLIAETLEELVQALAAEQLVQPAAGTPAAPESNGVVPGERLPFKAPDLQKYTDMQDFLLVDPIHEVDEAGWPARRPAA